MSVFRQVVAPMLLFLGVVMGALPAQAARQPLDRVVAIVNAEAITLSELNFTTTRLKAHLFGPDVPQPPPALFQKQVLNKMVLEKIQLQYAEKTGIEVDTLAVDQAIERLAERTGRSLAEHRTFVETTEGISFQEYRRQIHKEIVLSRLQQRDISQEISVASSDIDAYLQSPLGQDQSGAQYRLQHILLSAPDTPTPDSIKAVETKANQLHQQLTQGADFAQLAMQISQGQQALEGGNLGWRGIGEIPSLFVKHVIGMQPGEIAGPIRSASGFHLIKLAEKRLGAEKMRVETHVRQILIKPSPNTSDKEAEQALLDMAADINQGKQDFATCARKQSEELATATKGGDLGWITEHVVQPKFYAALQGLKDNEISTPFKTKQGWHLVQVLGRRTQRDSVQAARNQAREILHERKYNELLDVWLKRLKEEAQIEMLLDPDTATT